MSKPSRKLHIGVKVEENINIPNRKERRTKLKKKGDLNRKSTHKMYSKMGKNKDK
jgi:hypothetical protein